MSAGTGFGVAVTRVVMRSDTRMRNIGAQCGDKLFSGSFWCVSAFWPPPRGACGRTLVGIDLDLFSG